MGNVLDNNESPSRKVNEIDNRGTSFHIAKHWSRALASHDPAKFGELADNLSANEAKIVQVWLLHRHVFGWYVAG